MRPCRRSGARGRPLDLRPLGAEGANRTRITIPTEVIGHHTPEELAGLTTQRASMAQGWTGSLVQLDPVPPSPA
jgi:hypothetical protein